MDWPKNPRQVLAVFNAPNEVVDHEEHAVESATVTGPEWDGKEDLQSVTVSCWLSADMSLFFHGFSSRHFRIHLLSFVNQINNI